MMPRTIQWRRESPQTLAIQFPNGARAKVFSPLRGMRREYRLRFYSWFGDIAPDAHVFRSARDAKDFAVSCYVDGTLDTLGRPY